MHVSKDWAAFSPRAYLQEYYSDIGAENLALLQFLARAFREVPTGTMVLDFGGGPTIYTIITAAFQAAEIHFCDYLEANLEEVRQWIRGDEGAFDWSHFIKTALVLEGRDYSSQSLKTRTEAIRTRITRVMRCDAHLPDPIKEKHPQYDVLVTNFCAESATDDRDEWRKFVSNIATLLKPSGQLIMSTLKGADSYSVGKETFPAVYIMENDLFQTLTDVGFEQESIHIESVPADRSSRHYQGLMMTTARRTARSVGTSRKAVGDG